LLTGDNSGLILDDNITAQEFPASVALAPPGVGAARVSASSIFDGIFRRRAHTFPCYGYLDYRIYLASIPASLLAVTNKRRMAHFSRCRHKHRRNLRWESPLAKKKSKIRRSKRMRARINRDIREISDNGGDDAPTEAYFRRPNGITRPEVTSSVALTLLPPHPPSSAHPSPRNRERPASESRLRIRMFVCASSPSS
jgi:hypothetical protein